MGLRCFSILQVRKQINNTNNNFKTNLCQFFVAPNLDPKNENCLSSSIVAMYPKNSYTFFNKNPRRYFARKFEISQDFSTYFDQQAVRQDLHRPIAGDAVSNDDSDDDNSILESDGAY